MLRKWRVERRLCCGCWKRGIRLLPYGADDSSFLVTQVCPTLSSKRRRLRLSLLYRYLRHAVHSFWTQHLASFTFDDRRQLPTDQLRFTLSISKVGISDFEAGVHSPSSLMTDRRYPAFEPTRTSQSNRRRHYGRRQHRIRSRKGPVRHSRQRRARAQVGTCP